MKVQDIVSDDAVDKEIASTQKRNARMLNVDRAAAMGDTVDIDYKGFLNGEPFDGGEAEGHSLELGSGSFVPGFEEQLVGMSAGEEKDIDITFPENYSEDLAGKAVVFHVKVNEVSTPELPELDDEFAKDVSEFDTFAEYREDVRKNLQKKADESAESAFHDEIITKACEAMTAEIPDVMIEEKLDEMLHNYAAQFGMRNPDMSREELMKLFGMNDEALNYGFRPAAEAQVKTEVLLDAVAKAEGIDPSEEEIAAYCAKTAESIGTDAENIRRYFGEEFLKAETVKDMAMKVLFENAVPTEPIVEEKPAEEAEPAEEAAPAEASEE